MLMVCYATLFVYVFSINLVAGANWDDIAAAIGNRTAADCKYEHYYYYFLFITNTTQDYMD